MKVLAVGVVVRTCESFPNSIFKIFHSIFSFKCPKMGHCGVLSSSGSTGLVMKKRRVLVCKRCPLE